MKNIDFIDDEIFVTTKDGMLHSIDPYDKEIKYYALVMKCGHCGVGNILPGMFLISANSKQMAVDIAKNLKRVKRSNKNNVLGLTEVDRITFLTLGYINNCDHDIHTPHTLSVADLEERVIVAPERVEWQEDNRKSSNKIPIDSVKTADKYPKKYVLQRYFAPSRFGDRLVYPKNVDMKQLIKDYIHESTLNLGIKQRKPHSLAYYYQIYGENNDLGIRYNDGKLFFKNNKGKVEFVKVPPQILPHLEESKKQFMAEKQSEEKIKKERAKNPKLQDKPQMSSIEKFNKRYQKYLDMKNPTIKE